MKLLLKNNTPHPEKKRRATQRRNEKSNAELMNNVHHWDVHFSGADTLYDFLVRIDELAEG